MISLFFSGARFMCVSLGFSMTVHTWANKEERGTLRIRLKCSHNRRSKCKFAFQLCYGLTECFWYLRRGSGKHIHTGHELDIPRRGPKALPTTTSSSSSSSQTLQEQQKGNKPKQSSSSSIPTKRKVSPVLTSQSDEGGPPQSAASSAATRTTPATTSLDALSGPTEHPPKHPRLDPLSAVGAAPYCLPTRTAMASTPQPSLLQQAQAQQQAQQQQAQAQLQRSDPQLIQGRFANGSFMSSNDTLATIGAAPNAASLSADGARLLLESAAANQVLLQQQQQQRQQQQHLLASAPLGGRIPTLEEQEAAESLIASARPPALSRTIGRQESTSTEAETRRSKFIAAALEQQRSASSSGGLNPNMGLSGLRGTYPTNPPTAYTNALQQQQQQQLRGAPLHQNSLMGSNLSLGSLQSGHLPFNHLQETMPPGNSRVALSTSHSFEGSKPPGMSSLLPETPTAAAAAARTVYGGLRELPPGDNGLAFQTKKDDFSSATNPMMASSSSLIGELQNMLASNSSLPVVPQTRRIEGSDLRKHSGEVILQQEQQSAMQQQQHQQEQQQLAIRQQHQRQQLLQKFRESSGLSGLSVESPGVTQPPIRPAQTMPTDLRGGGVMGRDALAALVADRTVQQQPPNEKGGLDGPLRDYTTTLKHHAKVGTSPTIPETNRLPVQGADRLPGGLPKVNATGISGIPDHTSRLPSGPTDAALKPKPAEGRLESVRGLPDLSSKPRSTSVPLSLSGLPDHTAPSASAKIPERDELKQSALDQAKPKDADGGRLLPQQPPPPPLAAGASGLLPDHTSATAAAASFKAAKASRGASLYSSIDTFQFSSAGSLGSSVEDISKLEGFGGGAPANPTESKTSGDKKKQQGVVVSTLAKKLAFRQAGRR